MTVGRFGNLVPFFINLLSLSSYSLSQWVFKLSTTNDLFLFQRAIKSRAGNCISAELSQILISLFRRPRFSLISVCSLKECVDRGESRWNADWNDHWSLVLVNWFNTLANPLQPCLNSFEEIREKLNTCHDKFGYWANFIAVNYYTAGSGGGAFQAVKWLNNKFKGK